LVAADRFCGDCGFDITSMPAAEADSQTSAGQTTQNPVETPTAVNQQQPAPIRQYPTLEPGQDSVQRFPSGPSEKLGRKGSGNQGALLIMLVLLAVLFLGGGALYWWLDRGKEPEAETFAPSSSNGTLMPTADQGAGNTNAVGQKGNLGDIDLTRASTYLSDPGLKCSFYVNYPDGTTGIVERVSGQAVPNEAVRVSEVETGVDGGEEFGYGFHYVERADGTYYILDQTPYEIMPVLKNNLSIGQTWNYQDESGQIVWTVVDMGVDLDLGFKVFEDCLMVREDNHMADYYSMVYFAPGCGSVLVINPSGTIEYYRMTALEQIDRAKAAQTIIKWCPNYYDIGDDRTQTY